VKILFHELNAGKRMQKSLDRRPKATLPNCLVVKCLVLFSSIVFCSVSHRVEAQSVNQQQSSVAATLADEQVKATSPEVPKPEEQQEGWLNATQLKERVTKAFAPPKEAKSLHPSNRVWINREEQIVIVDGVIAQREAQLEMFACPSGTKEHESIISVFSKSQLVHAALLAIGAKPGSPAAFEPFRPASGTTVRVYVLWLDAKGEKQGTIAQKWVRKTGTKDCLKWDWVFAGSKEYVDEITKERQYMADSGELICVANFGTSTMDLVVKSEQANASLVFDAFTERIPRRNTPVRLVLSLSDEPPFGSEADHEKDTPSFLKADVPKDILKWLEPMPSDNSSR
jgi:hypothetical protein